MNIDRNDKVGVAQHHEGSMEEDASPASINTIPVEILTEIFGYFLPTGDVLDPSVPPLITFVSAEPHSDATSVVGEVKGLPAYLDVGTHPILVHESRTVEAGGNQSIFRLRTSRSTPIRRCSCYLHLQVQHRFWKGFTSLKLAASPLTWDRLTHVDSQFMLNDEFLDFLSRSQTLQDLQISTLDGPTLPLLPRRRLRLPQLRKFTILSSTPSALTTLINHLALPLLEDLHLGEWHSGDAWMNMFQSSSCQLKTLGLYDRSASDEGITRLLSSPSMTRLEELNADIWCSADGLLQFLTSSSEVLHLPFLRKMVMSFGKLTSGLLSAMLRSRLDSTPTALTQADFVLASARAYSDITVDIRFLKNLHESGFNITYS
ncbi:hypothetical protein AAF712_006952 [Marasmius tenuissimus]|uniref:F-box domain-containing protein n=1 Tax=Marasmius tenuissimus TaxID=585030 RepID=A0ABR2ZWR1_9AGAR